MNQQKYLAGRIFAEVEHVSGRQAVACICNCARLPQSMPVFLRHVWDTALTDPFIAEMVEAWDAKASVGPDAAEFWLGYYHRKAERYREKQTA